MKTKKSRRGSSAGQHPKQDKGNLRVNKEEPNDELTVKELENVAGGRIPNIRSNAGPTTSGGNPGPGA